MNNKGFTLLELLLSLTILAVMTALVFGAFWTGIRSWEKSEDRLPASQRLRVVPSLVNSQLASLCLPRVLEKDEGYLYLRGSADTLEFFSGRSLSPQYHRDLVYVRYHLKREDGGVAFSFYEKDIYSLEQDTLDDLPREDFQALLNDFQSITFSYLSPSTKKGWLDSWQPDEEGEILPRAIRIEFLEGGTGKGFRLIVPVRVEL